MISAEGRRHGGFFLIPAGTLIGFGLGILAGYMWTGLLLGLGGGFLIFITDRPHRVLPDHCQGAPSSSVAADIVLLLTGIYIMLSGIAIVVVPGPAWPDIAAGFFLLIGVWFIVRGTFHRGGPR